MTTTNKTSALRALAFTGLAAINSACTVLGPDYVRPPIDVPTAYKEATGSTAQQARDASASGRWWALYGDGQLDALIAQVEIRNYSLQAVEARVRQARSLVEIAREAQYPQVVLGGTNNLGLLVQWEIDLWGRIRRNIEASDASAEASEADLAAVKLSLQAQLAQTYFQLRVQDAEIRLLHNTAASYERSLQITRNQYAVGVASRGDIVQAQAQLGAAQAQMHDARVARAQFEHAIAVLIGKAPADFSLAVAPLSVNVPEVPPALPADLLERRPDIAAAERRMAVASAQIGEAEAAAYSFNLFAGVSIRRSGAGETLTVPLSTDDFKRAKSAKTEAAYDEVVANYRQTVLNGFREVEDNLVALEILAAAAAAQGEAVKAGSESVKILNNQYQAGIVKYQSVITAQANALVNERAALVIHGRRLVASVALIKALGGGWQPPAPKATKEL